jgi:hypothetical protein
MIPEIIGAPEAKAIPKHKGSATKKTTRPAGKSYFNDFKYEIFPIEHYYAPQSCAIILDELLRQNNLVVGRWSKSVVKTLRQINILVLFM